jgi:hypothetical protein
MNQRWLARRAARPAQPARKRVRANKYGRRGGPNRCGHDRRNFIRPRIAGNLPPFVYWAIEAFQTAVRQRRLPSHLNFRFHSRSERDETIEAMVPVMLAWTMVPTTQIARPSKRRPGEIVGYTVDHHIARECGVSESRIERGISTLKDWGWQHFSVGKHGRRLAAQPIDETEGGERRGRPAIRKWAPDFWRDIGISRTALKAQQQKYLDDTARLAAARERVAVEPIVEQLGAALWDPTSRPRPPP